MVCSYSVGGLAAGAGAVLPIIITDAAAGPAPAAPVAYSPIGAPRNIVGDCADVGNSFLLTSKGKRASWQPAFTGQLLGVGSDCEGGNLQRFSLWFGGDAQGKLTSPPPDCGVYSFDGSLTVVPTNGAAVVSDVKMAVQVTCRRRKLLGFWL